MSKRIERKIIRRTNNLLVRERRIRDRQGRIHRARSRRYWVRKRRYRNRFRRGVSVYYLPPLGVHLPPDRYFVDSSRGSYGLYLDTFRAPPVVPLRRNYTLEEVVEDPEVRGLVRGINIDTITFGFGSAEIREGQLAKLEDLADAILSVLDDDPDEKFLIAGHTDAVGGFESNLALSEDRAAAVQDLLVEEFGVPARNLESVGYGEQYLRVQTDGPEQRNRRVTVRAIGSLLSTSRR